MLRNSLGHGSYQLCMSFCIKHDTYPHNNFSCTLQSEIWGSNVTLNGISKQVYKFYI